MIVVTGATGQVGGELVRLLFAADARLRVVTRRPGDLRLPPGIEVVYGDCEEPATIEAAFAGADSAFLMSAQVMGSRTAPTHDIVLADAAARAGLRRVVKLSVLSGGQGRPGAAEDMIGRWARLAESAVTGCGVEWTLLRPGRFMSNALHWAPMIRRGDEITIPFATRPTASIDPADVAAVAAAALTGAGHGGRAYELSGPQALTPAAELDILGEVLGRPLRAVDPGEQAARAGLAAGGMPPEAVEAVMARSLRTDDGTQVLPTVAEITGRKPGTFADWAAAHADSFR